MREKVKAWIWKWGGPPDYGLFWMVIMVISAFLVLSGFFIYDKLTHPYMTWHEVITRPG